MMYDFDKHPDLRRNLMLEPPTDDYDEGESLLPPAAWKPAPVFDAAVLVLGLTCATFYSALVMANDGRRIIQKGLKR